MKVLHVTPEFPPSVIGGGAVSVSYLVRKLSEKGLEISVFSEDIFLLKKFAPWKFKVEKIDNITVYRFPVIDLRPFDITYSIAFPTLARALLSHSTDIIHAHGYEVFSSDILGTSARKLRKIPFILHLHGFPQLQGSLRSLRHKLYRNIVGQMAFELADKIIANSQAVANQFINYGVNADKVEVIYNGVDIADFANDDGEAFRKRYDLSDEELVVCIGRRDKIKGFQFLIRAAPRILREIPNLKIIIIGRKSIVPLGFEKKLEKLVRTLHLDKQVIFLGYLRHEEALEALAAADVIAVPSIYEPFGMAVLEGMAAGKPVVATKTGGIPEIIEHGKNGILVEPSNPKQLGNAIVAIMQDQNLAKKLSKNAISRAQDFDLNQMADKIIALYRGLV